MKKVLKIIIGLVSLLLISSSIYFMLLDEHYGILIHDDIKYVITTLRFRTDGIIPLIIGLSLIFIYKKIK